nr:hypothetical protein [uncultured Campylobacter sp.]
MHNDELGASKVRQSKDPKSFAWSKDHGGRNFANLNEQKSQSNRSSAADKSSWNFQPNRDYDKDPIVIKNYEKFFVYAHLLVFLQVSGLLISFIWDIVDFGHIYVDDYLEACIMILLIAVITYIFTAIRNKREIRFTRIFR